MSERQELICVNCPMGCELTVTHDTRSVLEVEGNQCRRGIAYAENEVFHPTRMVTTTVRVTGAAITSLPVKTTVPVPKDKMFEVIAAANAVTVSAPVKAGQVIAASVAGTESNLVATRSLPLR